MKIKDTDVRYTSNEFFKNMKIVTGINWKKAYDPTPKNPKRDALNISWNKKEIYLNPPFSKSRYFVKKLLDEMDKADSKIKKALIVLPWYSVENVKHRVSSRPKWYGKLRKRMSKYNVKRFHMSNQKFLTPKGKEIQVRVYIIYLKK
tara:strand:- start:47 stop:487 length:441 start_codon:yes stop_codon:yes gene_type:complete